MLSPKRLIEFYFILFNYFNGITVYCAKKLTFRSKPVTIKEEYK